MKILRVKVEKKGKIVVFIVILFFRVFLKI